VIVSASRGQYLEPGSLEPGFFLQSVQRLRRTSSVDSLNLTDHHLPMITISCIAALSKKVPHPGTGD
jgi:hypothetical protein